MIATPEDAGLFFDRWKEDRPPLKIRMWASSLFFDAVGTVTDFTPQTLELGGDSWKFTIPLEGVKFSFSDPREIPVASVRESETAQYEFGIAPRVAEWRPAHHNGTKGFLAIPARSQTTRTYREVL